MGGSGGAREAEGADEQEAQALAAAHRVHEAVQGGRQPCAPQQAPQGGQQGQEGPREIGLNWQFDFSTSFLNSLILPTYSLGRFSLFVCNLCIISISHIEFCFSRFLSHLTRFVVRIRTIFCLSPYKKHLLARAPGPHCALRPGFFTPKVPPHRHHIPLSVSLQTALFPIKMG